MLDDDNDMEFSTNQLRYIGYVAGRCFPFSESKRNMLVKTFTQELHVLDIYLSPDQEDVLWSSAQRASECSGEMLKKITENG